MKKIPKIFQQTIQGKICIIPGIIAEIDSLWEFTLYISFTYGDLWIQTFIDQYWEQIYFWLMAEIPTRPFLFTKLSILDILKSEFVSWVP